jgi:hypothetical protein
MPAGMGTYVFILLVLLNGYSRARERGYSEGSKMQFSLVFLEANCILDSQHRGGKIRLMLALKVEKSWSALDRLGTNFGDQTIAFHWSSLAVPGK